MIVLSFSFISFLQTMKNYIKLQRPFIVYIADNGLQPYSNYEYAVTAVNSAGSTTSDYTSIKTLQARPEDLMSPVATLDPRQLYVIFLSWEPPVQPNGNENFAQFQLHMSYRLTEVITTEWSKLG